MGPFGRVLPVDSIRDSSRRMLFLGGNVPILPQRARGGQPRSV